MSDPTPGVPSDVGHAPPAVAPAPHDVIGDPRRVLGASHVVDAAGPGPAP